jgi:membrane protease YdiL (CAAX protease family)
VNFSPDDLPESPTPKPTDAAPVWGRAPSPVQAERTGAPVKPGVGLTGWRSSADGAGHGPELELVPTLLDEGPLDPPWSGLDVFRLVIMAIVAIVACFLAMLAVVPGATVKARVLRLSALPELFIVAQMLAYLLLLGYMYILVTKERGSPRFWKALHWNWPANIWPFLAVGLAMQIGCLFLAHFLPFPKETPFDDLLKRHATIVLVSVFAVTLGPLMEELFFRGFLYPVLARRFGMGTGISVTALGFGLMHASQYGYSWASVLLIFLVGMVLGVVRARTDSVAAGFLVHMAYNGTIAVAMFAATGGFRHLERLNQ